MASSSWSEKAVTVAWVGLVACGVAIPFAPAMLQATAKSEVVNVVVVDKDRVITGSGESMSSKYIVFTETETFENTDSLFRGKFNSSDVQGQLRIGGAYQLEVYGRRVPFLSQYRNIVEIKSVRQSQR